MKTTITAIATICIFGAALYVTERNRREQKVEATPTKYEGAAPFDSTARIELSKSVRAPGRIEGRTEEVELRARIAEQIEEIHVTRGQWVTRGTVLVSLDSDRLAQQRDLAAAQLEEAQAAKLKLENGYRASEIETARQEYEAAMAEVDGGEKAYARAQLLLRDRATSQQYVDDLYSSLNAARATAMAARARLETLEAPPRKDDLMAATAAVHAALARLEIANINLQRSRIVAPSDGQILAVLGEEGELTGPDSVDPLIVMVDTSNLRAVAEIDEYDALNVVLGQNCEITSDGTRGVLARGAIVEVEPRMDRKRLFGQWAGERSDTQTRRVWIDLNDAQKLPIGLPVDVYIEVATED